MPESIKNRTGQEALDHIASYMEPEPPPKELAKFLLALYFLEKRRCAICGRRDTDEQNWCKKRIFEFYEGEEPTIYCVGCRERTTCTDIEYITIRYKSVSNVLIVDGFQIKGTCSRCHRRCSRFVSLFTSAEPTKKAYPRWYFTEFDAKGRKKRKNVATDVQHKRRIPNCYIENCKMRKTRYGPQPICHRAKCLQEHRRLKKIAKENGYRLFGRNE